MIPEIPPSTSPYEKMVEQNLLEDFSVNLTKSITSVMVVLSDLRTVGLVVSHSG